VQQATITPRLGQGHVTVAVRGRRVPGLRGYWQLLRQYLGPQRRAVLLMTMLLLTSIALQLVGPQLARSFIDAVHVGMREETLIWLALAFLLVSVVQAVMSVLATYWSERVAWTATNALRADLAAHLVQMDLSFHKARTPGELIERVDGDVSALAGFFSEFVVQLVGSVLLLLGVLVAVYLVDTRLGLAFTAFAVLALVLLGWVRRLGTPHWKEDRQRSAAFYGYVGEVLTATEDIRSSGAVPYAMRRFFAHLRAWWPVRRRAGLWSQAIMMAAIAAFAVEEAIAYGLGGSLYQGRALSLGAVYLVVAYTALLAAPIETIRTQLQDLQQADAAIARVRELLETKSRLGDGTEDLPGGALEVAFRAVRFRYEDADGQNLEGSRREERVWVLQDLSFRLAAGRVLGLLGRTGSGKTTIARLLFRLYDPQQGEVRVGGINVRRAGLAALRARVGLVTQDVQLFEASLRDNLTFFDPAISDRQLHLVLETLGLKPWVERLPNGLETMISASSLSAGEAQLVALARVFLKDPGLVILDEASSRLDLATEALLERALNTLLEGRTAIIIAHRLATVERADDILILEDGRLLEHGPRERLAADPYSRFAELQRTGRGDVLV
jgi:ATP-binding cassette, subfamily B, bacterial